mgnify:CR=1 FL=1
MKQMLAITRKELRGYFGSPMALIFIGAFLATTLFTFFWVDAFFGRGIADVRPLFRWMPVLMIFIFAFIAVITAMTSGNADGGLMVALSYIPFTAPMAMFVRIAMAAPAWYEVVISVALLIATTAGIGVLSAGIYRMGVLMYGKPPKPAELIKVVRMARRRSA